jgi:hypothetical protein
MAIVSLWLSASRSSRRVETSLLPWGTVRHPHVTDGAEEQGDHMRKLIAGAALALIVSSAGGTAFAGEVNGNGDPTPIRDRAKSICAFSGLEDGIALIGFTDEGAPIFIEVATGPGLVQNPHQENAAGIIHEPGIPGQECRGNLDSNL